MNRRGFFGLLGKLSAAAMGAKLLPAAPSADVITFDRLEPNWYKRGVCNWKPSAAAISSWSDPGNWEGGQPPGAGEKVKFSDNLEIAL